MRCPCFRNAPHKLFGFLVAAAVVYWCVHHLAASAANAADTSAVSFGATVPPALQIRVDGGTNQYGKRTIFSGSGVDFGTVTFTHPELVGNGDAYIANDKLMLESVLEVTTTFNGLQAVRVDLSKLAGSPNPFHRTSYSLSNNRSELPTEILTEPQANRLTTMMNPGTFAVRMVFEIVAQQSGTLSDRFRLLAGS